MAGVAKRRPGARHSTPRPLIGRDSLQPVALAMMPHAEHRHHFFQAAVPTLAKVGAARALFSAFLSLIVTHTAGLAIFIRGGARCRL